MKIKIKLKIKIKNKIKNKKNQKIEVSFPDFFRIDRFPIGSARKCPDRIRISILTLGKEAQ